MASKMTPIEVVDQGALLAFSFEDMLRYAGTGSPAGVAFAYQAMRLAFPLLDPDQPLERREVWIETAFRGPGGRDGFELVTRGLTGGRYLVTRSLERPHRGATMEQFVFRFLYRDRRCTLVVREGLVTDEFVALAAKDDRTPEEERHLVELKETLTRLILANGPAEVFDIEPDSAQPSEA